MLQPLLVSRGIGLGCLLVEQRFVDGQGYHGRKVRHSGGLVNALYFVGSLDKQIVEDRCLDWAFPFHNQARVTRIHLAAALYEIPHSLPNDITNMGKSLPRSLICQFLIQIPLGT
jgi:hypothetical protein